MDEPLKHRLVGAAVLVSVAIIFIPLVLESPDEPEQETVSITIPANPEEEFSSRIIALEIPSTPVETNLPPSTREVRPPSAVQKNETSSTPHLPSDEDSEAKQSSRALVPRKAERTAPLKESATKKSEATKQISTSSNVPLAAWVVQLGTFSNAKNAVSLRDQLKAKGYASFIESTASKNGTLNRVLVGPEPRKGDAERLLQKLKQQLKLKDGLVIPYTKG